MESPQRTYIPDLFLEQQPEHVSAEEDRCPQMCLVSPPLPAEEPFYGGNHQFHHPCGTVSYCVPQHLQAVQAVCNRTPMMISRCTTTRSTDSLSRVRGTTQRGLQVPQVPDRTYAQQPDFVPRNSVTMTAALMSSCHEAFDIEPQPQTGHSHPPESPLKVLEQLIQTIFSKVKAGELRESAARLTDSLQYLQIHIEKLGLTLDHEDLKEWRKRFWINFNTAWLATLQHQYNLGREMIRTHRPIRNSNTLISARTLGQLAEEVVKFCDDVEKYGLIDYEMGFWEEEILDLITCCLNDLEGESVE